MFDSPTSSVNKPERSSGFLTLGIETSCDETSAAVVREGREILGVRTAPQDHLHETFGGVVPEVASRRHVEVVTRMVEEALSQAEVSLAEIGLVAVTQGPGLIGSLLVGVSAAKGYALACGLPLAAVNHLEGHLLAAFIHQPGQAPVGQPLYPTLGLIASGGHSDLVLMTEPGAYETVGQTRDDAAGEALDKAARLLGLGYPGGPALERAAREGEATAVDFPRPVAPGFDYSFSGLKTALVRHLQAKGPLVSEQMVADVAASYQQAVVDSLVRQLERAARELGARQIVLGGGVSANQVLRGAAEKSAARMGIVAAVPPLGLCTDNAAVIAAAGYQQFRRRGPDPLDFDVFSVLPL
ncbi:MAG: tRNA (adenosine(37)-N6)-threonylcarbamoyltransferase complex transferase subunit TsaD [candidate division WS1 bacterium]|nr:tRNA (adenosine(37)-N6)-threonylcarbamoyltransferase complex transferase subunit TsaD [candidate division WS1 bacterium]